MDIFVIKVIPHLRMCARHCLLLPLLASAQLLCIQSAAAHDFWVEPEVFTASDGTDVNIRLREGVGFKGNTLPYIPQWFADFSLVTTDGRKTVVSMPGDDPAAVLDMPAGPALIGYQSLRNLTTLDAAKFNRYLEEEGIAYLREQRIARGEDDAPAREYFTRCAKALLQAADTAGNEVWATELGYTLELIPEANPYGLQPDDELSFRLLLRGEPAAGLLLQAFTQDDPDSIQKVRVSEDGRATVQLNAPGVWLIKAVNIEAETKSADAEWQSHWASFVFELPAAD